VDLDHVETHRARPRDRNAVASQVVEGCPDHPPLLRDRDTLQGSDRAGTTSPYFDETQAVALFRNQVDLSAAATVLSG
jgi:hypothetical protein